MGPEQPLPLPPDFTDPDDFVDSLLNFATSSWLLQTLCGGVHILDFYTRSPDLYSTILPQSWRDWFKSRDIMDILDFLMREDIRHFESEQANNAQSWRDGPLPPADLLQYVKDVRKHLLARDFPPKGSGLKSEKATLPRHIALGMKVKKVHEVDNFARYVDRLTSEISEAKQNPITHLVDFGSGQNYLGRALAAPPYSRHIVAVESKQHNIEGAKNMDVLAKLVPKPLVMRNKKEYRAQTGKGRKKKPEEEVKDVNELGDAASVEQQTNQAPNVNRHLSETSIDPLLASLDINDPAECVDGECVAAPSQPVDAVNKDSALVKKDEKSAETITTTTNLQVYTDGQGSVQYVEHIIKDGNLTPVIDQVIDASRAPDSSSATNNVAVIEDPANLDSLPKTKNVNAMVISLHSCGNLVHFGLRSLFLNPHISAVAMVGCCYNLVTERLGPPTYKLPTLRPNHPRLVSTSNAFDPNGFPMSEKLATYPLPHLNPHSSISEPEDTPSGIRLNITARMMAVQAPFNWGPADSQTFFTRHFYRALLQRIFLDRNIISAPVDAHNLSSPPSANGHTSHVTWTPPNGRGPGLSSDGTSTPLTIGTLRKFAYSNFVSYVRAAEAKLTNDNSFCEVDPAFIREKMAGLTDAEIRGYEEAYAEKKKELSVMWSLMAFSAGVVESVVVVDRWLWLREQEEVGEAWVESVFEYRHSPRNLVVVGVKK